MLNTVRQKHWRKTQLWGLHKTQGGSNFVLSIVFGGVVSVMAFVFGIGAFEQLRDYNFDYAGWEIEPVTFSWVVGDFAPALVLIALVIIGLYATITERHRVEG